MPYSLLIIIFVTLMVPGIFAEAFTLPGLPFMFVVALAFGFVDKFVHISTIDLIILGGIAALSILVNYLSGFYGAKMLGATKKAIIAGVIGFLIGLIFFPPFGGFVGLFLGVFIIEISLFPDLIGALKKASGSLVGSLVGVLINLLLAGVFIALFTIFALK